MKYTVKYFDGEVYLEAEYESLQLSSIVIYIERHGYRLVSILPLDKTEEQE